MNNLIYSEVKLLQWPFNYPGDNYLTNVFSQVIILVEDVKDTAIEFISDIKDEIKNDKK